MKHLIMFQLYRPGLLGKIQSLGMFNWDGECGAGGCRFGSRVGGGWGALPGAPAFLPSSPQLSSSHLDTMWEQGTEARGIAEGRV